MNPKLKAAIVAALATSGAVTYDDLADVVGVSKASIRIVLRALRAEGTVQQDGVRRECSGSGRAKPLWRLRTGVEHDPAALDEYQQPTTEADRFWAKVYKRGLIPAHLDTPCWLWMAGKQPFSYGHFHRAEKGQGEAAHRVAWELTHGASAGEAHVLHKCDNPPCCNPDHLYVGGPHENRMDALRRGRDNTASGDDNGSRTVPHRRPRAESHGNAKLSWSASVAIRTAVAAGATQASQAKKYNVSPATVSAVINNKRWVRNG